ncbi:MAG: hypothetical protein AVDCRST_MAG07-2294, partial [uncultured Frankineae bacterium]
GSRFAAHRHRDRGGDAQAEHGGARQGLAQGQEDRAAGRPGLPRHAVGRGADVGGGQRRRGGRLAPGHHQGGGHRQAEADGQGPRGHGGPGAARRWGRRRGARRRVRRPCRRPEGRQPQGV